MSGAGRRSAYRKHLTDETLHSFPVPNPDEGEVIARIVQARGGNLFEIELPPLPFPRPPQPSTDSDPSERPTSGEQENGEEENGNKQDGLPEDITEATRSQVEGLALLVPGGEQEKNLEQPMSMNSKNQRANDDVFIEEDNNTPINEGNELITSLKAMIGDSIVEGGKQEEENGYDEILTSTQNKPQTSNVIDNLMMSSNSDSSISALALLPTKFRKLIWIKRGDFVIVTPTSNDISNAVGSVNKCGYDIKTVLYKDQVKHLKSKDLWPSIFMNEKEKHNHENKIRTEEDEPVIDESRNSQMNESDMEGRKSNPNENSHLIKQEGKVNEMESKKKGKAQNGNTLLIEKRNPNQRLQLHYFDDDNDDNDDNDESDKRKANSKLSENHNDNELSDNDDEEGVTSDDENFYRDPQGNLRRVQCYGGSGGVGYQGIMNDDSDSNEYDSDEEENQDGENGDEDEEENDQEEDDDDDDDDEEDEGIASNWL